MSYRLAHCRHVERNRGLHRVKRYRPRIEGLFARIERWTSLTSDETHWRSISRENVLTVYGINPASRIADPADPTRVFSWLICRSYDDRGNATVYDYVAENDDDVDISRPNELHRVRNRYLKRIRYGNREPVLLDLDTPSFRKCHIEPHDLDGARLMFEVVFDYGEGHFHVVKRVETFDYVSRNRFVTRYTYHHGFYDGVDREFRGFGRVDQLDTRRRGVHQSLHRRLLT